MAKLSSRREAISRNICKSNKIQKPSNKEEKKNRNMLSVGNIFNANKYRETANNKKLFIQLFLSVCSQEIFILSCR